MLFVDSSVWITDPEAIKTVYSRDRENRIAPATKPALEPMFGLRSVFLADGAAHRRKRRLLMPPFHGERMAAWRDRMIAAAEREIDGWPVGKEFALAPRMAAVTEGIMHVNLDTGVPCSFGVLTTFDRDQALARSGPKNNKGAEAAETAIEMANLVRRLQGGE